MAQHQQGADRVVLLSSPHAAGKAFWWELQAVEEALPQADNEIESVPPHFMDNS